MKTAEELVTSIVPKAFVGYDKEGFACQMKYSEFVKTLVEHDKEIIKLLKEMGKEVKKELSKASRKMGSTGADDYWVNATKDQIWEFGRFRGIEDCQDLLNELERVLNNPKKEEVRC